MVEGKVAAIKMKNGVEYKDPWILLERRAEIWIWHSASPEGIPFTDVASVIMNKQDAGKSLLATVGLAAGILVVCGLLMLGVMLPGMTFLGDWF